MRHIIRNTMLGVLAIAAAASAQYGPWRGDNPYYRGYDRGGYRGGTPLIDRVLSDLDRGGASAWVDHHERKHFEQARRDLLRFEDNWSRGRFDKDRLDGAIDNIHHLVDSSQLHPAVRQALSRDMWELRDFRASGGGYAYRPY